MQRQAQLLCSRVAACADARPRRTLWTRAQPVSWGSLALVALTGAGIMTYYNHEKTKRVEGVCALHALPAQKCARAAC